MTALETYWNDLYVHGILIRETFEYEINNIWLGLGMCSVKFVYDGIVNKGKEGVSSRAFSPGTHGWS